MRARESLGFREPGVPLYRADYVEALLELGRFEQALAVLDPWEVDAERLGREWARAEVTRCRGLVAAARGDVGEARRLLEEAVEMHEAVGDPFARNRALLALGAVLRRALKRRDARNALERSLTGFETLGARRWVEKASAELGSIGGRTREGGLTSAELRVAELVAQGSTNREVAATLFLSERTVESHLTHAYAKLGVRSRTDSLARLSSRASKFRGFPGFWRREGYLASLACRLSRRGVHLLWRPTSAGIVGTAGAIRGRGVDDAWHRRPLCSLAPRA